MTFLTCRPCLPSIGAVNLQPVDDARGKTGPRYARFIGDWFVLAPPHGKLPAAIPASEPSAGGVEGVATSRQDDRERGQSWV